MGKGGRFACILLPMLLSMAALACLIVIALGGLNKDSSVQRSIYFFRANTSDISQGGEIDGVALSQYSNSADIAGVEVAAFYDIYLGNYCSGGTNGTITFCSSRQNFFWFDPITVWGLNDVIADKIFPSGFQDGLKLYKATAHWMIIAYAIAFIGTALSILVGCFAILSRWGSLVTSIVVGIATTFTIAWAVTVTAMYAILVGVFDTALRDHNVQSSLGASGLAVTWLAAAFSIAAGILWTCSICCVSGHSDHPRGHHAAKRADTLYQRVPSPNLYNPHHGSPMPSLVPQHTYQAEYTAYPSKFDPSYEPYRSNA